jgi:putative tricarboxylic transport membrane protein
MLGRDGVAGLACLAGSLWLLALTRGLPQPALVPIGPGFYPRIVLGITAAFSAVLVVTDLLARRRARSGTASAETPAVLIRNPRLVGATFGIFTAYVALMPLLGFRLATGLFVLALQAVLELEPRRHWLRIVFEGYLSVLLPRGRWTEF